jgi:hypothetical protein
LIIGNKSAGRKIINKYFWITVLLNWQFLTIFITLSYRFSVLLELLRCLIINRWSQKSYSRPFNSDRFIFLILRLLFKLLNLLWLIDNFDFLRVNFLFFMKNWGNVFIGCKRSLRCQNLKISGVLTLNFCWISFTWLHWGSLDSLNLLFNCGSSRWPFIGWRLWGFNFIIILNILRRN